MKKSVIFIICLFFSFSIFAQSNEDIINLFVKGVYAEKEGNYQNAISYYKEAKSIIEKQNNVNIERHAMSAYKIASCYYKLGEYSKIGKYLELGSKVLETINENSTEYIVFSSNLANLYSSVTDYSKAIELGLKALDVCKTINGENHPDYIRLLDYLSIYYNNSGNHSRTIEICTQELELLKKTDNKNNSDYASTLKRLANSFCDCGDYPKAIEYGSDALDVYKHLYGEYNADYAKALSNLVSYYSYLGNYSIAIELGTKALDIRKSILGENNSDFVTSLNNLAFCYYGIKNYPKAIELGSKALEIEKRLSGETSIIYTTLLNNLALYNCFNGDMQKAIELCSKALNIYKFILDENHPDYSTMLGNLALYLSYSGNYVRAKECAIKALDIRKKTTGEEHPEYAALLRFIALCDSFSGNTSQALKNIMRSVSFYQNNLLSFFSSLNSHERALYWNNCSSAFTDMYPSISYLSSSQNVSDLYNKSALFSKSLLLTTGIELNRLIKESGDEDALKMIEELHNQRTQLLKLYQKPKEERLINVDSLAQAANLLEKKLVKQSKVYGDFTKRINTTWQNIQDCLSEDEIAVEFLSFDIYGTDSTMVAALTLRKDDKEPKFFPLFELSQLKEMSETDYYLCSELTALVWKPLQKELLGIKNIYFSPDGILHRINIEYAPGMEKYNIYRLSTTREIIDLKANMYNTKIREIALYGGIDYESTKIQKLPKETVPVTTKDSVTQHLEYIKHRAFVDSLDLRGITFNYLPGTLTEVQNISKSFRLINHPTIVLVGMDATETSVKELSGNGPSILHISTHGFYFTEKQAMKKDYLHFTRLDGERNVNEEDKALSRSGLLMAGANKSLNGHDVSLNEDDGILTANEISQIDLRGTDLVVLSACETGRGDIMQGEGVFGLQRGFKKAGVKTILMSLWKVSDIATEILMTEFYKNYCEGKSKRESLSLAQRRVREHKDKDGVYIFKDPYYWAGFVMLD